MWTLTQTHTHIQVDWLTQTQTRDEENEIEGINRYSCRRLYWKLLWRRVVDAPTERCHTLQIGCVLQHKRLYAFGLCYALAYLQSDPKCCARICVHRVSSGIISCAMFNCWKCYYHHELIIVDTLGMQYVNSESTLSLSHFVPPTPSPFLFLCSFLAVGAMSSHSIYHFHFVRLRFNRLSVYSTLFYLFCFVLLEEMEDRQQEQHSKNGMRMNGWVCFSFSPQQSRLKARDMSFGRATCSPDILPFSLHPSVILVIR